MKVWAWRRRDSGVMLPAAEQIGDPLHSLELVVVEVTDQGRRRPTKVARLVPPGSRVAVAELVSAKLAWFNTDKFVLSGEDCLAWERKTMHASQSWLCQFDVPSKEAVFKVWTSHQEGVEMSRHRVLNSGPNFTASSIGVSSMMHEQLGRHTTQALVRRATTTHLALLDCDIAWMSEERFCLTGFQHYPQSEQAPARLLRQGWFCEPDIPVLPAAVSERLLRKMSLR
ncbi:UNVERIFIED_ORG: hypothetical protein JN05_02335 [Zoogloea ramigera]